MSKKILNEQQPIKTSDHFFSRTLKSGDIAQIRAELHRYFLLQEELHLEWPEIKQLVDRNDKPVLRLIAPWLTSMTAMDIALREPKGYQRYIRQLRNAGMTIKPLTRSEEKIFTARVGDRMDDGSIYLAFCNGRDWYVTAQGDALRRRFNEAATFVHDLAAHGCRDWQIPDEHILRLMIRNRDEGAFVNTYTARYDDKDRQSLYYWSTSFPFEALYRHLTVVLNTCGTRSAATKNDTHLVRAVRSVPRNMKEGA